MILIALMNCRFIEYQNRLCLRLFGILSFPFKRTLCQDIPIGIHVSSLGMMIYEQQGLLDRFQKSKIDKRRNIIEILNQSGFISRNVN